jgi:hypothetical protein
MTVAESTRIVEMQQPIRANSWSSVGTVPARFSSPVTLTGGEEGCAPSSTDGVSLPNGHVRFDDRATGAGTTSASGPRQTRFASGVASTVRQRSVLRLYRAIIQGELVFRGIEDRIADTDQKAFIRETPKAGSTRATSKRLQGEVQFMDRLSDHFLFSYAAVEITCNHRRRVFDEGLLLQEARRCGSIL